ncbi:MAG: DUF4926 domain-containing protein [Chloroflexota bacterium]|nr:DUF4926 domain-containing protein [Chloroflexota bacterium]
MKLYDVVALLEDMPTQGLKRGQVGTANRVGLPNDRPDFLVA